MPTARRFPNWKQVMLCKARNATLQVNARHIEMAADDQDPKTAMKQLLLPAILSTG